ncbi:unnamed protein product [Nezara viridula]|uniref:XPA C-terminal domain-containing protein n=1 Tax=Nezara viridula TaxID=85310 RepID=A0A9P0H6M9_NEZVI|nr:unnamed protein product [Nezara viridula]
MSKTSEDDHETKRIKLASSSKSEGVITEKISPSKANVIRIAGQNYIDTEGGFLIEEQTKPKEKEIIFENQSFTEEYKCLQCSREFLSSFLQKSFDYLVCDGCKDSNDKHSLITRTDAKAQYLLKDCDIDKREPPLKFILRKNPHNSNWGQMKLYLHLQVEERAIEVWGSLEKLEEAHEAREEKRIKAKTKRYNKNLKALRMEVRSSIFKKTSGPKHEHEFGPENYNEEEDIYYRTCLTCKFVENFEKM